jgi:hypothetical protein
MVKASDNAYPSLLITEGTEPSAPAAGKQRLYIDSTTHLLKATNSSGTDRTIEGGGGTALQVDRVSRTSGDVTTTSTTFVDLTGASITMTTGAHSCMVTFISACEGNGTTPFDICVDIDVDGTRMSGGTHGLYDWQILTANRRHPVGLVAVTAALTAASHTFKVQWRVTAGTGTMYGGSTVPYIFSVIELPE